LEYYRYQRPELEDRLHEVEDMLTAAEDKYFHEQALVNKQFIEAPPPQAPAAPAPYLLRGGTKSAKEFISSGKVR